MEGPRISVGLFGVQELYGGDPAALVEVSRLAEEAGVDQVNLVDHVVMGERTDRYPFGPFPVPSTWPWYEPLTALAEVAGATRRIRLGTGVLIAPLRSAALLAKQAATLDVLSGGRLDLGVGTGWQREEYEASGIPFEGRAARMDDQLRACRALWAKESPAAFRADTVRLERIWAYPKPVQDPLPLWFGIAPSDASARRIAELGVGWLPIYGEPDFVSKGVGLIRQAFERAGRDPAELRVRAIPRLAQDAQGRPDLERTIANVPASLQAGVTDLEFVATAFVRSAAELPAFLERIARIKSAFPTR